MRLEVLPTIGVGPIRRGMTIDAVLAAFPEPQRYEDWMGGNLDDDVLCFHGLRVHFGSRSTSDPLDVRVETIVVHDREDATLFGRPMADWCQSDLSRRLCDAGFATDPVGRSGLGVRGVLELSFATDGGLTWAELYVA